MKSKILIIDDEATVRESLQQMLSRDFFISTADCAKQARPIWKKEAFDLVLLDILLPDASGIELLEELKKDYPKIPAIMITGTRQIKTAVTAMKLGAYDYITKPFNLEELNAAIKGALESKFQEDTAIKLSKTAKEEIFFGGILGRSPKMLEVFKRIAQVMHTQTTVLIQGESGTGKEVIARAIHYHGTRREHPFVPVHIASLSENLLESELFGHEKGAFTGATQNKKGTLELANGGTLLLDEIGDIPLSIQVKLLRVIQEREFRRVGGTIPIKLDVRFIAATNKDLWDMVEKGKFREDLFYRISVIPVQVPNLRERAEDIPVLVHHFIEKFRKNKKIDSPVKGFSRDAMELLKKYNWPGNVRELENLIEQLLIIINHEWILPHDLPGNINNNAADNESKESLSGTVSIYEKKVIEDALSKSSGVVTKAASLLGTTRRILRYKMDKLGILAKK